MDSQNMISYLGRDHLSQPYRNLFLPTDVIIYKRRQNPQHAKACEPRQTIRAFWETSLLYAITVFLAAVLGQVINDTVAEIYNQPISLGEIVDNTKEGSLILRLGRYPDVSMFTCVNELYHLYNNWRRFRALNGKRLDQILKLGCHELLDAPKDEEEDGSKRWSYFEVTPVDEAWSDLHFYGKWFGQWR